MMSVELKCGDPVGLVGYLYGECDDAERAAVEAHLAVCPSCASELRALGATRTALASWAPPDAALGFRITREREDGVVDDTARVLRPARWWQRPVPAWAQAAAALLIFAVGVGLGMRTEQAPGARASLATNPTESRDVPAVTASDLAALEARLRAEMSAQVSTLRETTATAAKPAPVATGDDAVMQRVRALVTESEERQRQELALRVGQLVRDVDTQRRMDLLRIEQTFGQMEGLTRPELANQRQMINYLYQRAGFQRAPQQ